MATSLLIDPLPHGFSGLPTALPLGTTRRSRYASKLFTRHGCYLCKQVKVAQSQKVFSGWSHLQKNEPNHCPQTFQPSMKSKGH